MRIHQRLSGEKTLQLERALLIYSDGEDQAVCTVHQIARDKRQKDRPVLLAGRPVERKDIIEFAAQLSGAKQSVKHHILPFNLLVASVDLLMWHLPSQRRRIYVQTSDKTFNADVNGREVLHPALLFVAKEAAGHRDLFIWALDSDSRPTEATKLFRAPYYNIYDTAHLCEGTYKLPGNLDSGGIPQWESAFFDTHFSHTNVDQRKLTNHPHGHNALWREMAKTRRKLFDAKYLKPANDAAGKQLTLGKVMG